MDSKINNTYILEIQECTKSTPMVAINNKNDTNLLSILL